MAGIDFPADRIHSTTVTGEPKSRVLARLADDHPGASAYVFVEDKFGTLEKVCVGCGVMGCGVMWYGVGWGVCVGGGGGRVVSCL